MLLYSSKFSDISFLVNLITLWIYLYHPKCLFKWKMTSTWNPNSRPFVKWMVKLDYYKMHAYDSYDLQIEWLNLWTLYFIILHLFVPLLFHFQTKHPFLCIKVKNCHLNANKMYKGKNALKCMKPRHDEKRKIRS